MLLNDRQISKLAENDLFMPLMAFRKQAMTCVCPKKNS